MNAGRRSDLATLAVLLLAYVGLEPGPASLRAYTLVYSLSAAWFFAWLAWDVGRANARSFMSSVGALLAAPFLVTSLFMLARPFLLTSDSPDPLTAPTLWAFIELLLLLNVSLVICVMARLLQVMRARAERDALTGLLNRRAFEARFRHERQRALRQPPGFALVLIDLDHFKRINDQLGHEAGDQALVQCAARLRAGLREVDALARLGGEEFVVLLPATPLPAALQVAERLRAALAATPLQLVGRDWAQTASMGVAHSDAGDAEQMLQRADQALYRVKGGGRNAVATLDA